MMSLSHRKFQYLEATKIYVQMILRNCSHMRHPDYEPLSSMKGIDTQHGMVKCISTETWKHDLVINNLTTNLSAAIKDCNVELIPVRVADQDVAVVGHINTVWEEGDVLSGDAAHQFSIEVDHNNSMSLK